MHDDVRDRGVSIVSRALASASATQPWHDMR